MSEKDILFNFGRNIKAERNRAGLSQEGLGNIIGTDGRHIGRIERGQANPKLTTIIAIAKALNISIDSLISYNK